MFSKILPRVAPGPKDPFRLALKNEIYALNLKPYKRVNFEFDPFHSSVASIREFLIQLDTKRVRKTNLKCIIKTDIVTDLKEPKITGHLENGKKIVFKTANLNLFELLQYFNSYTQKFDESSA